MTIGLKLVDTRRYAMELSPPFVAVALERLSGMGLQPKLGGGSVACGSVPTGCIAALGASISTTSLKAM